MSKGLAFKISERIVKINPCVRIVAALRAQKLGGIVCLCLSEALYVPAQENFLLFLRGARGGRYESRQGLYRIQGRAGLVFESTDVWCCGVPFQGNMKRDSFGSARCCLCLALLCCTKAGSAAERSPPCRLGYFSDQTLPQHGKGKRNRPLPPPPPRRVVCCAPLIATRRPSAVAGGYVPSSGGMGNMAGLMWATAGAANGQLPPVRACWLLCIRWLARWHVNAYYTREKCLQ